MPRAGVYDAVPVLFDPSLDVALLHARDLDLPGAPVRGAGPGPWRDRGRPRLSRAVAP